MKYSRRAFLGLQIALIAGFTLLMGLVTVAVLFVVVPLGLSRYAVFALWLICCLVLTAVFMRLYPRTMNGAKVPRSIGPVTNVLDVDGQLARMVTETYSTPEQAVAAYITRNGRNISGLPPSLEDGQVCTLERDGYICYVVPATAKVLWLSRGVLSRFVLKKTEDGFSNVLFWRDAPLEMLRGARYSRAPEEERAALWILESLEAYMVNPLSAGGNFVFYGVTGNKTVYNMSILGTRPTAIIPFTHGGQALYFWYYAETRDPIGPAIAEGIDLSNFSLAELINLLQIRL